MLARKVPVGLAVAAMTSLCLTSGGAGASGLHTTGVHAPAQIVITEQDWYGVGEQNTAFNWLFQTYMKTHPGITIKREPIPSAVYPNKLLQEAQTNALPDIANVDNPYMPQFEATGKVVPLNAWVQKWGQWNSYIPASRIVTTGAHNNIYGIQIGTNDLAIFYNKKLFAEAGVTSVPKTWAQLVSVGKQIISKDKGLAYGAFSFGATTGGCDAGWQFEPWLMSAGANLSVPDITSPGTVAALSLWVNLVKSGVATKSVLSMCQETNVPWLVQGKVAMIEDGPWDLGLIAQAHATNQIGYFEIPVQSPSDKPSSPMGGEVWTIPQTNTASEQAAWNFIQWSQTPSVLLQYDNRMNYLSVRPAVSAIQQKQNPQLTAFVDELASVRSRTQYLGALYGTYSTDVSVAIQQAILGEATPAAALANAKKTVQQAAANG
jgi:multiple sugar transport system substrate-binding protein